MHTCQLQVNAMEVKSYQFNETVTVKCCFNHFVALDEVFVRMTFSDPLQISLSRLLNMMCVHVFHNNSPTLNRGILIQLKFRRDFNLIRCDFVYPTFCLSLQSIAIVKL